MKKQVGVGPKGGIKYARPAHIKAVAGPMAPVIAEKAWVAGNTAIGQAVHVGGRLWANNTPYEGVRSIRLGFSDINSQWAPLDAKRNDAALEAAMQVLGQHLPAGSYAIVPANAGYPRRILVWYHPNSRGKGAYIHPLTGEMVKPGIVRAANKAYDEQSSAAHALSMPLWEAINNPINKPHWWQPVATSWFNYETGQWETVQNDPPDIHLAVTPLYEPIGFHNPNLFAEMQAAYDQLWATVTNSDITKLYHFYQEFIYVLI